MTEMAPTKTAPERTVSVDLSEMSDEEWHQYLEDSVQRFLGMSLDEFMECAAKGSLPEHAAVAHLVLLTGATASTC